MNNLNKLQIEMKLVEFSTFLLTRSHQLLSETGESDLKLSLSWKIMLFWNQMHVSGC